MTQAEPQRPSREEYQEFLRDVQLRKIRLVEAKVRAAVESPKLSQSLVSVEDEIECKPAERGFEARHEFKIFIRDRNQGELGAVELVLSLLYESKLTYDEPEFQTYFNIFKAGSLPLNSWPFAREFVHNSMLRMGWLPLVLPLSKPDVPSRSGAKRKKAATTR